MPYTYRAAVIGLGRMGSTYDDEATHGAPVFLPYCHTPSYVAAPGISLVSGADPHDEQRAIYGQRWGIAPEHLYADYREMLAKERPDIVSVCTTARLRSQIVQDVARAGARAIWAEKPIALTLEEADAMVRTCKEHGVALAINCARRWNPYYHLARQMIDAGEMGTLLQVNGYGQCGLSHNGSHLIDIVRYMAGGQVSWVFGEMESDEAADGEMDLMGNGYLAFDNGVRAYVRAMPCGVAFWEIDVIGTKGRFRSVADTLEIEYSVLQPGGQSGRSVPARMPLLPPARFPSTGLAIVEDLVSAIENGHSPRCSGEDGLEALEVAVALRQSHRLGGSKVTLPLTDRTLGIQSAEIRNDQVPARVRRLQQA